MIKSISIIILNWNGKHLLEVCLNSLENQTFINFEVIIVDNGSTDGSTEFIKRNFAWVKLISLDTNFGFCKGNNQGAIIAQGDYIVFLNNDTETHPNFLQSLYDAIEAHPDAGFCSCRMLNFKDRFCIDNVGIGLHVLGKGYQIGAGMLNGVEFNKIRYVFGASGGAALYRRTMLDQIGMFDEDFFSHVEDTDLSWRAQLAGYRCIYVPDAIVYHIGGATSQQVSEQVLYRIQRNITLAYMKNMPLLFLLLTILPHILYSLYWLLRGMKSGQARVVWQAKVDALQAWPAIKKKRSEIQTERKLSFFGLVRLIDWRMK